ncbi:tRNA:m(4)X modification enzyme TRM13 homolog [Battus philenor]|uniref:tRNA:m(4)X modification enzyme TRM13 homolog n=1 Tax=Battus philenor TaxID=42288 RepID=UPI0035D12CF3
MEPQCQFYVVRKKRLCRMTVRPGKQYCGEHTPEPNEAAQDDTRIPCPNDPKHTCYARRLQKHLSICNARPQAEPEYIARGVNAPPPAEACPRRPLREYSVQQLLSLIDKVNHLYAEHVEGNIETIPEQPIHPAVREEFEVAGRTESSLRHLRQVSSILHLVEAQGLVRDGTCYVELGAGKGQLSLHAWQAWCSGVGGSGVVLVERAARRHKREGRLRSRPGPDAPPTASPSVPPTVQRLRADLAHLRLERAPAVGRCTAVVGLAKHLCGVATDFGLRCVAGESSRAAGVVMATCCHHRCELGPYVGDLQDLGISNEEFNIMLGVVSWATCGDGRARTRPTPHRAGARDGEHSSNTCESANKSHDSKTDELLNNDNDEEDIGTDTESGRNHGNHDTSQDIDIHLEQGDLSRQGVNLDMKSKEAVGRRAKALIDWGRVMFLRNRGFEAKLCYFVPQAVSPENVCIVASRRDRPAPHTDQIK